MKTSTLKTVAAIALSTAGCAVFAQAMPGSPTYYVDPATGATTYVAPAPYYDSTQMRRNCAGLSDRQTERSCKQGITPSHSDVPNSLGTDYGGKTDDQAG